MNLRQRIIARRDELQPLFDTACLKEVEAANEKLRLQGENRLIEQLLTEVGEQPEENKWTSTKPQKKTEAFESS
jgi:hypothetical protein